MGLLDGSLYGGGLLDPNTASMLGFAAGIGQASGPSRLPISTGQVMGSGIQGMLAGQRNALTSNLLNQEIEKNTLGNAMLAQRYNMMQDAMNGTGAFGSAGGASGSSTPAQTAQTMNAVQQPNSGELMRRAMILEALVPGAGKALLEKNMPGYQLGRAGGYYIRPDGSMTQLPQAPAGYVNQQQPDGSFNTVPVPGGPQAVQTAEDIKNQSKLRMEEGKASFGYGLETGEPPPVSSGPPPNTTAAQAANPRPLAFKPQGATPGPSSNGDFTTDRGTVVPSSFGNQKMGPGSDLINKQNTESINTEKGWAAVRPAIETQRARLGVISDSLSDLDAKGFTEARANIANRFHGLGMDGIANAVMSQSNVADVQRILWAGMQDVMQQLKVANAGSGGRILRSEFEAYMEHAFSPDQIGPSLRTAVTQQLGTMYQMGNMIDDYYGTGRQRGWRDANQFQSAYLSKNPIEGFVKYAEDTTPQFKGSTPAAAGTPQYTKGQTATNPQTKERVMFDGNKWVPIYAGGQSVPLQ